MVPYAVSVVNQSLYEHIYYYQFIIITMFTTISQYCADIVIQYLRTVIQDRVVANNKLLIFQQ